MKKRKKTLLYIIILLPLIIGFIGYFVVDGGTYGEKLSFLEAVYASAALYFVNPIFDNKNIFIDLAQISALIVTTSAILTFVTSMARSILHLFERMHLDSTAVYSDTELGKSIAESLSHGYLCSSIDQRKIENTKDHIVLFDNDNDNVIFYQRFMNEFKKKKRRVYIGLHHMDSSLLNKGDDSLHFFCLDEMVARDFWKKNNFFDEIISNLSKCSSEPYRVGLIGYGPMGQAIFKQAFLTNIFDSKQNIEYHIWGGTSLDVAFLKKLNTANSDSIIIHDDFEDSILLTMNRLIVTSADPLQLIQRLLHLNYKNPIYCYCERGYGLSSILESKNVQFFGDIAQMLTEENIKTEKLFLQAKLLNLSYKLIDNQNHDDLPEDYLQQADFLWNELNGFAKGSNIARADYLWIEKRKTEIGTPKMECWHTEHIRWCRYHYYNGWKYSAGKKNEIEKTHPDLRPFSELDFDEREKDGIVNEKLKKIIDEM